MASFQDDCPHCGTRSVAFLIRHEHKATKVASKHWYTLAVCGQCSRGVLATFLTPDDREPSLYLDRQITGKLAKPVLSPAPPDIEAPEHTPPNVARYYTQGMENVIKNWDAAGVMFRKVLDVGLKNTFPNDSKGTLYERIKRAADRHDLTPELAKWAHQIRLDGNDAAHDEKPFSEEDAKRLQVFTDLVLRYLFTLPEMVKEAQQAGTDASGQPSDAP